MFNSCMGFRQYAKILWYYYYFWLTFKLFYNCMWYIAYLVILIKVFMKLNINNYFCLETKWLPTKNSRNPWKWQWNPRNSMEISEVRVVQQMHVLSDVFWVPESKSILVFVKFLYGISLNQNIFFTTRKNQATKFVALLGPDNFFLTTWEPDNLFCNKWKPDNFFRKFTKPPPPQHGKRVLVI